MSFGRGRSRRREEFPLIMLDLCAEKCVAPGTRDETFFPGIDTGPNETLSAG